MYQPVTPWGDQVRRTPGASNTRTLMPGGARGVRLKSKAPLRWALADRWGLIRYGRSIFKVSIACRMSLSQRCNGKEGSQLLGPAIRWSL